MLMRKADKNYATKYFCHKVIYIDDYFGLASLFHNCNIHGIYKLSTFNEDLQMKEN